MYEYLGEMLPSILTSLKMETANFDEILVLYLCYKCTDTVHFKGIWMPVIRNRSGRWSRYGYLDICLSVCSVRLLEAAVLQVQVRSSRRS